MCLPLDDLCLVQSWKTLGSSCWERIEFVVVVRNKRSLEWHSTPMRTCCTFSHPVSTPACAPAVDAEWHQLVVQKIPPVIPGNGASALLSFIPYAPMWRLRKTELFVTWLRSCSGCQHINFSSAQIYCNASDKERAPPEYFLTAQRKSFPNKIIRDRPCSSC